jgi:DNA-binding MarR family transcriptional regulator
MSEKGRTSEPGREAWELLVALVFSHRQRVLGAAATEGLTPGHAMALLNLDPDQPKPMRRLGEQLRCDPSYLTGVVDRLEELGLVERRASNADRRVKELVVTPTGALARQRLRAGWMDPPDVVLALSPAEQTTLRRLARRLVTDADTSELAPFAQPRSWRDSPT